ncbi:MAG: nuclear transport factor 2 family protein [Nevskia sp.]|nr:nuclear transport factor 2 family protein [Nevskia sp.]
MTRRLLLAATAAFAALALPVLADAVPAPVAVVDAFHAALHKGDSAGALRLLSAEVDIFEQGFVDHARANYAGAHIAADVSFAQATERTVLERRILWFGDNTACVLSQTRTKGTFQGQAIDLIGTETMVLQRAGAAWSISHIHWSAHPGGGALQPAGGDQPPAATPQPR